MYFGHLTNNIIYDRLAPHVRSTLHEITPRTPSGRLKHHLRRRLTDDIGHPKLRDHLTSVVTIMRLSSDYDDFMEKLDQLHPRYGDNYALPLDTKNDSRPDYDLVHFRRGAFRPLGYVKANNAKKKGAAHAAPLFALPCA